MFPNGSLVSFLTDAGLFWATSRFVWFGGETKGGSLHVGVPTTGHHHKEPFMPQPPLGLDSDPLLLVSWYRDKHIQSGTHKKHSTFLGVSFLGSLTSKLG